MVATDITSNPQRSRARQLRLRFRRWITNLIDNVARFTTGYSASTSIISLIVLASTLLSASIFIPPLAVLISCVIVGTITFFYERGKHTQDKNQNKAMLDEQFLLKNRIATASNEQLKPLYEHLFPGSAYHLGCIDLNAQHLSTPTEPFSWKESFSQFFTTCIDFIKGYSLTATLTTAISAVFSEFGGALLSASPLMLIATATIMGLSTLYFEYRKRDMDTKRELWITAEICQNTTRLSDIKTLLLTLARQKALQDLVGDDQVNFDQNQFDKGWTNKWDREEQQKGTALETEKINRARNAAAEQNDAWAKLSRLKRFGSSVFEHTISFARGYGATLVVITVLGFVGTTALTAVVSPFVLLAIGILVGFVAQNLEKNRNSEKQRAKDHQDLTSDNHRILIEMAESYITQLNTDPKLSPAPPPYNLDPSRPPLRVPDVARPPNNRYTAETERFFKEYFGPDVSTNSSFF